MFAKRFFPFILISQVYVIFYLNATEVKSLRANHGEHCNKTIRCDTSSFLSCTSSVCNCLKADTMFYDPVIKSCLVLVGEKCKYHLTKSTDEYGEVQHDSRGVLEDELDCVQNAWCNRSGFCMCAGDYVEVSNGTCISKRNLGETCTTDGECRQDQYLYCINGHCGCNETVSTYSVLIRQCVGKAGKACLGSSSGCVYNADCVDDSASLLGFSKRRMRQSVQICSCNSGFVADYSTGLCRVGLGGQCSNFKPCASGFKCKNSQCVCPYENVQLAMIRSQMCLSLVGGPCNETAVQALPYVSSNSSINQQLTTIGQTFECIDNANCALTSNGNLYECKCNDRFVANGDGTCDLAYGSSCNGNPYMSMVSGVSSSSTELDVAWNQAGLSCDRSIPLYCINGICQCESRLYEYDSNNGTGMCLGKYGAKCILGTSTVLLNSNGNNATVKRCTDGAECLQSRDVTNPPYGKCICSAGFSVSSNRTCVEVQ